MADPLLDLTRARVAIWLDGLSRARLAGGSLVRLIRDRHVVGVTTNPTIFARAIPGSDHDDVAHTLEHEGLTTFQASWAALADTVKHKLAKHKLAAAMGGGGKDDPR
jgi:transaldolase